MSESLDKQICAYIWFINNLHITSVNVMFVFMQNVK